MLAPDTMEASRMSDSDADDGEERFPATRQQSTMDDEIQLIRDDDGLAVIGDPTAVERFLESEGLSSTDLGLPRLGSVLRTGSGVAQAGSEIAANSGRWVKLTKESAQAINK